MFVGVFYLATGSRPHGLWLSTQAFMSWGCPQTWAQDHPLVTPSTWPCIPPMASLVSLCIYIIPESEPKSTLSSFSLHPCLSVLVPLTLSPHPNLSMGLCFQSFQLAPSLSPHLFASSLAMSLSLSLYPLCLGSLHLSCHWTSQLHHVLTASISSPSRAPFGFLWFSCHFPWLLPPHPTYSCLCLSTMPTNSHLPLLPHLQFRFCLSLCNKQPMSLSLGLSGLHHGDSARLRVPWLPEPKCKHSMSPVQVQLQ